uniref:hypothetical protein n=1 Tax=Paramuribaculum intestinale TaxID=2094151 RepID=UPI0025B6B51B
QTWKNYPILNEPGKGRYAIYFRLNERAVIQLITTIHNTILSWLIIIQSTINHSPTQPRQLS